MPLLPHVKRESLCCGQFHRSPPRRWLCGDYALVRSDYAFRIPSAIDDAHAAPLLCAGIIGYRSFKLSQAQPGDSIGLYGFGASAHIAIQIARHLDCRVFVFTRGEEHRRLAFELGAEWTGDAKDNCPVALDASVIFAPAGWIVPLALKQLRPGGTAAINAIHMSPIPQFDYGAIYGERTLRSVTNYTREDGRELLELASEIPIRTTIEEYPLEEVNRVLREMKLRRLRAAAVLRLE